MFLITVHSLSVHIFLYLSTYTTIAELPSDLTGSQVCSCETVWKFQGPTRRSRITRLQTFFSVSLRLILHTGVSIGEVSAVLPLQWSTKGQEPLAFANQWKFWWWVHHSQHGVHGLKTGSFKKVKKLCLWCQPEVPITDISVLKRVQLDVPMQDGYPVSYKLSILYLPRKSGHNDGDAQVQHP